ncbi:MAG: hypothetical protein CL431_09800 [Acidimicrobiaceae bacterium]|jgi:pimeloyl-ACP methyl ester carboxylesterase|nr:hypothetical protein [Acidimicrobiaceae bacterium]|tara:strand:+ start:70087 stop:70761 length:675 start_codon:yes stop_codon:yes gene_type:complete
MTNINFMKSVMLVHGAWHGSWCWEMVERGLNDIGIETCSVNLPFTGVEDDVAAVEKAIMKTEKKVILVGHSYGGIVISKAAEAKQKVDHLVYLSAILLESGESMQLDDSKIKIEIDENLLSVVKPEAIISAFYEDVDPSLVASSIKLLRPFPISAGSTGLGEAWREKPSTYIVCRNDNAVPPSKQFSMARKASRIVEWDCAHSPFFSNPELLITLLSELALASD